MAALGPPLLVALLLWWASTGAILWLVRRPRAALRGSLLGTGALAAAAAVGLVLTLGDTSAGAAYLAFGCALTIWGWHEFAFLTGAVAGARRAPPPPDASGWTRFRAAAAALMHHEIALALTAVILVALSWGAPNLVGAQTFLVLFALRLSTKLNLFLGVPNPPTALLPEALAHLAVYFRRRRFNALFPVSLALSLLLAGVLLQAALHPAASPGATAGHALLFGLAALGVIEHLFLMLPSPERALWGWALGARKTTYALAGAGER